VRGSHLDISFSPSAKSSAIWLYEYQSVLSQRNGGYFVYKEESTTARWKDKHGKHKHISTSLHTSIAGFRLVAAGLDWPWTAYLSHTNNFRLGSSGSLNKIKENDIHRLGQSGLSATISASIATPLYHWMFVRAR
jgi:hypothetical protein